MTKKALGNKIAEAFLQPISKDEVITPIAREIYQKAKVLDSKEIWNILREESESKLALMETSKAGPSLIKAFDERMECRRLLEEQGRSNRQKSRVLLMFKASEANLHRTALLMANNPLQHPTDLQGGDSPAKYLPTGLLAKRKEPMRSSQRLPPLERPPKLPPQSPRHAGQPGVRSPSGGPTSLSVQASEGQRSNGLAAQHDHHTFSGEVIGQSSAFWEPLTFSALMEIAPTVTVPGEGAFRYGRTAYWNVTSSSELPP